jgi:hypothetical protein
MSFLCILYLAFQLFFAIKYTPHAHRFYYKQIIYQSIGSGELPTFLYISLVKSIRE